MDLTPSSGTNSSHDDPDFCSVTFQSKTQRQQQPMTNNKSNQKLPASAQSDLAFGETAFSFLARWVFKALN